MNRIALLATAALIASACTTPPDCSPAAAFNSALNSEPSHAACEGEDYLDAYHIGQTLAEMRSERDALLQRAASLNPNERMRLRVLERDIPEVETLARLQGLMEPAPPPEM